MEAQNSILVDSEYSSPFNSSQRRRKDRDRRELASLGKQQVLQRKFGFLSILGFSSILISTWEGILNVLSYGLVNGGPAGVFYGFLVVWIGMLAVAACLAEMASMAPTSGGQYYWVAMLSPRNCGRLLSYVNGFLSVAVWQAILVTGGLVGGAVLESLILLNHPDVQFNPWHTTLLFYGFVLLALFVNTYLIKWLPALEGMILILHILGFFAVFIPVAYLSHLSNISGVFTSFDNLGGWNAQDLSFFVGLPSVGYAFFGIDTAAHLAEEVQKASITVPRSLVATVALNGALGLGMLVVVLSAITDVDDVLENAIGYPFISTFAQIAGLSGGTIMACILLVLYASANVSFLATASRILWAFARDNGLPGSRRLAQVNKHTSLPIYSIGTTTFVSFLLALVNLFSITAFNALLTGTLCGYLASLLLPCSLLLYRRIIGDIGEPILQDYDAVPSALGHNVRLRWGPWRMQGTFGLIVNTFACLFLTILFIFSFWPSYDQPTAQDANYASVIFGFTVVIALVYYSLRGRKFYLKPVAENRRWLKKRGIRLRWNSRR